jgi:hypothetical protein
MSRYRRVCERYHTTAECGRSNREKSTRAALISTAEANAVSIANQHFGEDFAASDSAALSRRTLVVRGLTQVQYDFPDEPIGLQQHPCLIVFFEWKHPFDHGMQSMGPYECNHVLKISA